VSSAAKIESHIEAALDRLVGKLRDQSRMSALVTAMVAPTIGIGAVGGVQELEDVFFQIRDERSIDVAVGDQLDGIGRILVRDRESEQGDDDYRRDLKAWIKYILSQGEGETLIFVIRELTNSTEAPGVRLAEHFPGSIIIYYSGSALNSEKLANIMGRCAAAGIRVDVVQSTATMFRFDIGPGYDLGTYTVAYTETG